MKQFQFITFVALFIATAGSGLYIYKNKNIMPVQRVEKQVKTPAKKVKSKTLAETAQKTKEASESVEVTVKVKTTTQPKKLSTKLSRKETKKLKLRNRALERAQKNCTETKAGLKAFFDAKTEEDFFDAAIDLSKNGLGFWSGFGYLFFEYNEHMYTEGAPLHRAVYHLETIINQLKKSHRILKRRKLTESSEIKEVARMIEYVSTFIDTVKAHKEFRREAQFAAQLRAQRETRNMIYYTNSYRRW